MDIRVEYEICASNLADLGHQFQIRTLPRLHFLWQHLRCCDKCPP